MHRTFPYMKLKVSVSYKFGRNGFASYFDPKPKNVAFIRFLTVCNNFNLRKLFVTRSYIKKIVER